MLVGELAKRIGRSIDTIKRWEEIGLLRCARDGRGRRVYEESHVQLGCRLADLGSLAQRRSEKLEALAELEPVQLQLISADSPGCAPQW
jgi:DNA-binding transcriptional MerR regulator